MIRSLLLLFFTFWCAMLALAGPVSADPGFVTRHQGRIGGGIVRYTAIAEPTPLRDEKGETVAEIFSFTYLKEARTPSDSRQRPVLFVFNGGPGSASVWLHLGVVGPKTVELSRNVNPSPLPPYPVVDNPHSLLDVADLVFIDPVGTGYSRLLGAGRPEDFYGVDQDAAAVAQFIQRWLTKYGRWDSPKFVMGESYGAVRAAMLSRDLMGGPLGAGQLRAVALNGILLVGPSLKGPGAPQTKEERAGLAARALPGMAAAAWFHRRVKGDRGDLAALHGEVTRFARAEYEGALRKAADGTLAEAERQRIRERLSHFTGLSEDSFGADLALPPGEFAKRLLADAGLDVGMYDSRYTLPSAGAGIDPVIDDPAMGLYTPPFVAGFHRLLAEHLRVALDRPYKSIVWKGLNDRWDWKPTGIGPPKTYAEELAASMRRNGELRLFIGCGYFDLVTSVTETQYALEAGKVPAARTTFRAYPSGHMVYLGGTEKQFADDVRAFIRQAAR